MLSGARLDADSHNRARYRPPQLGQAEDLDDTREGSRS